MTSTRRVLFGLFLSLGGILLAGCRVPQDSPASPSPTPRPEPAETHLPEEIPNSFDSTSTSPSTASCRQPEFVPAAEAPYLDEELVLGVAWEGEAKAYSITVLRFREMVDDEMGGIPILVTY